MAVGGFDANGIYKYGEDDNRALFSDLLNLLGSSVSSVITALTDRISPLETKTGHLSDSGFLKVGAVGNPAFGTGWTGVATSGWDGLAYRRRDAVLYINGAINKASWAAGDTIFTLPNAYRPGRQTRMFAYGSAMHIVDVFVDGTVKMTTAGSGSLVLNGVVSL